MTELDHSKCHERAIAKDAEIDDLTSAVEMLNIFMDNRNAEIDRLRVDNADLLEALQECADDLEALIEDEYKDTKDVYTSSRRRYQRDIAPVRKARAAIAKATGKT